MGATEDDGIDSNEIVVIGVPSDKLELTVPAVELVLDKVVWSVCDCLAETLSI